MRGSWLSCRCMLNNGWQLFVHHCNDDLYPASQLPPVIQNMAFQKYSNMEQSLFTRFVRLGVPTVQLDAQGRARPSLCELYQWRYRSLGNLPHVMDSPEFQTANPGFFFDYQLINVEDFNGVGETEPTPYFYQVCGCHGKRLQPLQSPAAIFM